MTNWSSLRFGRAAGSYHDATPVQKWMASRLLDLLPRDASIETILELGCGTGHLTRLLVDRFPTATLAATDISKPMLEQARANWPPTSQPPRWELLDARCPRGSSVRPELIASNAVVQWFPDLDEHFRSIRSLSVFGSIYILSGFCRSHFYELERILVSDEFGYPPGPGHDPSEAISAAEGVGWKARMLHEETRQEIHGSALAFLKHLAASGATRPPPEGRPLTRSRLQRLLSRLAEEASVPGGISITWKPWFLLLEAV